MRFFLCLLCTYCLSSCFSQKGPDTNAKRDFSKFPIERKLNEVEILKVDQSHISYISLYNDSILTLVNSSSGSPYHFYPYHLKKGAFLPPQLEYGRMPDQALSFLSYGIENGYKWVYDINKSKIIFSGFYPAQSTDSLTTVNSKPVPGFYYSVQLLNDSSLITSGDYDSPLDYKIAILNLNNSKIERQMIRYSPDTSNPYNRQRKMAYESFLFLKPSKTKCVLASRYADRIEIVDIDSGKSKVVVGPEGFEPNMIVMTGGDGKKLSARGPDTRYAFVRGKTTENFIYLLYSGDKDDSKHAFYGNYIYVYDWNGSPVQRLELSKPVLDFTITSDDSLIYTYNPVSKNISSANIKTK